MISYEVSIRLILLTVIITVGIYEIGFYRGGNFSAKYLGRAVGNRVTIRKRLRAHATAAGNQGVAKHLDGAKVDNLYARCALRSGINMYEDATVDSGCLRGLALQVGAHCTAHSVSSTTQMGTKQTCCKLLFTERGEHRKCY